MMQMIAGTIKNAVKLDMLTKNWEQKKSGNQVLSKKERNARANMSPEQRQLEQFKEELAHNREQSRNNELANKIMNGEDLTPEEEKYLAQNNPGQLSNYRRAKAERQAYEEKLRKCKTKDEVQRLKTNTMNAYLAELKAAPGEAKVAKAMELIGKVRNVQKAELHFIESGGYAQLPTEADEAIDRAEERREQNEDVLEILEKSADSDDEESIVDESVDIDIEEPETSEEVKTDKDVIDDEKHKEVKPKKKKKDPLEEILSICKRYIPNVDGGTGTGIKTVTHEEEMKPGNKINIAL